MKCLGPVTPTKQVANDANGANPVRGIAVEVRFIRVVRVESFRSGRPDAVNEVTVRQSR